jgi:hypothetical protein
MPTSALSNTVKAKKARVGCQNQRLRPKIRAIMLIKIAPVKPRTTAINIGGKKIQLKEISLGTISSTSTTLF